jgi:DNA-binding MarR family transcriptional regulator
VDRLVNEGLVKRRSGKDKRDIARFVTKQGKSLRDKILKRRLSAIRPSVELLHSEDQKTLAELIAKMLSTMELGDLGRKNLRRLCEKRVCENCPIPTADIPV